MKDTEKDLLFEHGILEKYYDYLMSRNESYLCRFFGIYTIKVPFMGDISCYIMNNIVGLDFANIIRIYDLKGSTYGRKCKLSKK